MPGDPVRGRARARFPEPTYEQQQEFLMSVQRQLTEDQMRNGEADASQAVDAWLDAYKAFPNAVNFDGVVERLRTYQTTWMHGRKR